MFWEDWVDRALSCFHRDKHKKETTDEAIPPPIDPLEFADDERLDKCFQSFLNELDLPPEKHEEMLGQSREKKISMLTKHSIRTKYSSERFLEHLKGFTEKFPQKLTPESVEFLQDLVIALRTQENSFVNSFLENGGISILNHLLEESWCEDRSDFSFFFLSAFRALLNSSIGRQAVLDCSESLRNIAASIECQDPKAKIVAVEVLSGLCFVPEIGHKKVLTAITEASQLMGERVRFQRLIDSLHRRFSCERQTDRVRTAVIGLINALLSTGPAENSTEYRHHLRYELLLLGVQEVIDSCRVDASQRLDDHFDLFEMMRKEDELSISGVSDDSGASSPVDFDNVVGMAEALQSKLSSTVALPHFASLLQHLFMVPCDEKHIPLWRLFDLLLQHLTLQTTVNGITDVHQPLTGTTDMNEILSRLHTQCEYEDLEKEHERLREDLEAERMRVVELENRLSDLQDGRSTVSRTSDLSTSPSDPCSSRPSSALLDGVAPVVPPISAPPPPPPPPPLFGSIKPVEEFKKNVPLRKGDTRTMNWTKIPKDKIKGTVWEFVEDEKMYKHIDLEELSTMFAASTSHKDDDAESIVSYSISRKHREEISVIDSRKAQNCTIMLSKLRMTNREIRSVLLNMDEKGKIPKDMIEQMLKFLPTREETQQLNETVNRFKSPTCLAQADRYLYEVSQIPRFEQRLKCLHIIRSFKERVELLSPAVQAICATSQALCANKRLRQYLALVLAVGNYLNQGKRNGNAYGFTMQSLNSVNGVRNATRADRNLHHYIVQLIERKFPDITKLKRELNCVYEASRFNKNEVAAEIRSLEQSIGFIRAELSRASQAKTETVAEIETKETKERKEDDRFDEAAKSFITSATKDFRNLEDVFAEMKGKLASCAKLFCFEENSSPDEIFSVFAKWLTSFSEAHHAIWREHEEEETRKRQTVARTYFAKKSRRKDKERDFDQLIFALQNGELFSEELSRLRTSFRHPPGKKREKAAVR
ncbi:unnamed protein product, partial [Mesorhabditis belari]|uniref:Uncharacterized protein n=1 Tax=Mesorhabditis belari TaxID=2138241 RepID=A0AAF3FRP9_9BILA